ncbi:bactofilin family protein [Thioflexithrix psekupsensis]|uniref:Cell shape determination protein CcmA n=1 Tax=Thioflexithrix psekupsensis TaxID=1570016 RepID=A0A251X7H1_9GAMM|nr:polymer-forming cytoskeletal protein [Thioflexithrix psekupsensis]OUD13334.1 cell shape determination protein CcmA [Thioflexithrix psekupsensis]
MWGRNTKEKKTTINSLIAKETEVNGNIYFEGGLHVDGRIKGNVLGKEGCQCILTLSVDGCIEGNVRTDNAILNGQIVGDVYVMEHLELAVNARIKGNVYYNLIEMAMGAEVNGSLVHYSAEKHRGQLPTAASSIPEAVNPEQFAHPDAQSK